MITVPEKGVLPISHNRSKDKVQVKKFGGVSVSDMPLTLGRARMSVENQKDTEFCTAYQVSKARAYSVGIDMSPEFQVALEGEYVGSAITDGTYPHIAMNAARVNGALPKQFSIFSLEKNGPDFIADWMNWPSSLFGIARPYAPHSPYAVGHGTGDMFDNIRGALFNAFQAGETEPVLAYGNWYREWNAAANNSLLAGYMPVPSSAAISLHAYLFVDWITDPSGNIWLVAHLSQGEEFGDKGFLYFDRATINKAFAHLIQDGVGLYIWRKNSPVNWSDIIGDFISEIAALITKTAKAGGNLPTTA